MKAGYFVISLLLLCQCNESSHQPVSKKTLTNTQQTIDAKNEEVIYQSQSLIQNDTISKILYPNGKLKYLIIHKDSADCKELHLSFYENGNIKEKGCQGNVSNADVNTGMSVGIWYYYDSLNNHIDSSIYYNNDIVAKAYIEKRRYFNNGQVKSIERYNNYDLYETDIKPIGSWKVYNDKGKLIKTLNHGKIEN